MSDVFVVIGSNSFSGAHFVDCLLSKGHKVIGISRSSEISDVFLPYKKNKNIHDYSFHKLDLNKDLNLIVNLIAELKPVCVVNFAAQGMVAQSWQKPKDWFQTNTLSNILLHDELRKFSFIKRYVHISTPEVYGNTDGLLKENFHYNPSTPYAVSRAAADLSLISFYNAYKFPVVFTRAANVYGPGQQLYRIIPKAIISVLLNQKIPLHGGGSSERSFIHIKDVCEGTYMVATKGVCGSVYHFSTDRFISIYDLVQMITKTLGVSFESSVDIIGERLGKDKGYFLDTSKAKAEFGWEPHISLEQGIDETISWVKSNLDILRLENMEYVHKQ